MTSQSAVATESACLTHPARRERSHRQMGPEGQSSFASIIGMVAFTSGQVGALMPAVEVQSN